MGCINCQGLHLAEKSQKWHNVSCPMAWSIAKHQFLSFAKVRIFWSRLMSVCLTNEEYPSVLGLWGEWVVIISRALTSNLGGQDFFFFFGGGGGGWG